MSDSTTTTSSSDPQTLAKPTWQPLSKIERRIVGVLVEKAKTTPDQYPLSLNGLTNGCNQKSNRSPQMSLEDNQVETALVRLREIGAAGEVQGGGRVPKFRHYMKEWLGVDGAELAVMTELLLRGDQAVGELRGRANRMTNNEIKDVAALRPVLQSLFARKLIIALTPAGRGQVISHNLYQPDELIRLREKYGTGGEVALGEIEDVDEPTPRAPPSTTAGTLRAASAVAAGTSPATRSIAMHETSGDVAALRSELAALRDEVSRLKKEVEDLWANVR
jgi:uncharacterized protein YceH (UPF0502 family)